MKKVLATFGVVVASGVFVCSAVQGQDRLLADATWTMERTNVVDTYRTSSFEDSRFSAMDTSRTASLRTYAALSSVEAALRSEDFRSLLSAQGLEALDGASSDPDLAESYVENAIFDAAYGVLVDLAASGAISPGRSGFTQEQWGAATLTVIGTLETTRSPATSLISAIAVQKYGNQTDVAMALAESAMNNSFLLREALATAGFATVEEFVWAQPDKLKTVAQLSSIVTMESEFLERLDLDLANGQYSSDEIAARLAAAANKGQLPEWANDIANAMPHGMNASPCQGKTNGMTGSPFGACARPGALPKMGSNPVPIDPSPIDTFGANGSFGAGNFQNIEQIATPVPAWMLPGNCFGLDINAAFGGGGITLDPLLNKDQLVVAAGNFCQDGAKLATAFVLKAAIADPEPLSKLASGLMAATMAIATYAEVPKEGCKAATKAVLNTVEKLTSTSPTSSGGSSGSGTPQDGQNPPPDPQSPAGPAPAPLPAAPNSTSGFVNPMADATAASVCGQSIVQGLIGCMFPSLGSESESEGTGDLVCGVADGKVADPSGADIVCGCRGEDGGVCVAPAEGGKTVGFAAGSSESIVGGSGALCVSNKTASGNCPDECGIAVVASVVGDYVDPASAPDCSQCKPSGEFAKQMCQQIDDSLPTELFVAMCGAYDPNPLDLYTAQGTSTWNSQFGSTDPYAAYDSAQAGSAYGAYGDSGGSYWQYSSLPNY